jgi:hypothetical protein
MGQPMQKNDRTTVFGFAGNLGALVFMCCVLVLTGCAQPQQRTPISQILVPNLDTSEAMALVEDVLGQMHFTIEKADLQSGLMRTRPLSGAQFFEFWRSDNVGPDNSLAANLHTIRRTVELEISPEGNELCIACNVRVQRLSLPERQVSSTARAYEMFSRSSPTLQRLSLNPEQQKNMAWIDLDNDVLLAGEILRRIEAKISDTSDPSDLSDIQQGNET